MMSTKYSHLCSGFDTYGYFLPVSGNTHFILVSCYPGIVRGIDTIKGVLYVITPVPQSSLEKVNLLLQGYIQIPTCLLQVRM